MSSFAVSNRAVVVMHVATAFTLWPAAIVTGVLASQLDDPEHAVLDALRTVHAVLIHVSFAHTSIIIGAGGAYLLTRNNAGFLYRRYVRRLFASLLNVTASLAYWYAAFLPRLCDDGSGLCSVLNDVYNSYLVFAVATVVLQCIALLLFGYTYISKRYMSWERMQEIEHMFRFHPSLVEGEPCTDVQRFCRYWMQRPSKDVIAELPARSVSVMRAITRDLDENHNGVVSMQEFVRFAAINDIIEVDEVEQMWNILSAPSYETITLTGIENALYDISFHRRRLAMLLLTDSKVIKWAMRFLEGVTYSGCAVVAFDLWGYTAFGPGIDLLKVYLVILTYTLDKLSNSIRFIVTMIVNRPFNIGDVLILDPSQSGTELGSVGSKFFQVARISPGITVLSGSFPMQVANHILTSRAVRNVSTVPMNDCVCIEVPLCTSDDFIDRVHAVLKDYALKHPYHIDARSLRHDGHVWARVTHASKQLECHWTYAPIIHDRSFANSMMFQVRNAILTAVWQEIREDALVAASAGGGAFNTDTGPKFKVE